MVKKADQFYIYIPSDVVAIISVIVFSILSLIHIYRLFRTKTWFCIPFVIGALSEVLGFACRAHDHSHRDSLATFIIQACAILLAPIFFAASIYMFLSRIIRATGLAEYSPIRTKWLTWIFVAGDMLCLNIQSGGSSFLTNPKRANLAYIGKAIILVGLGLQILVFFFFVMVAGMWHSRVRNRPAGKVVACSWNWERYLYMLYVVSVIITIRNLYRIAEYAMDKEGYLMVHEWPTYIFDALLMAVVLIICAFWYVGQIGANNVGESRDSVELMITHNHGDAVPRA